MSVTDLCKVVVKWSRIVLWLFTVLSRSLLVVLQAGDLNSSLFRRHTLAIDPYRPQFRHSSGDDLYLSPTHSACSQCKHNVNIVLLCLNRRKAKIRNRTTMYYLLCVMSHDFRGHQM